MRLETALSTSREGINVHGQAIAVVGDNISNASTTGYKASRAEFADLLADSANPSGTIVHSGCGATLQCVRTLHQTGIIENTGRSLDLAIGGNGFFLVGSAESPNLTRAGNFQIGRDGYLETASGDKVLGFSGADGTTLGPINMLDVNVTGSPTGNIKVGGNLSSMSEITAPPTAATTFQDINRAASFSSSVEIYDSLGGRHAVSLSFFKTGDGAWKAQAFVDSAETGGTAGVPQLIGEIDLGFDEYGQIAAGSNATMNANVTFAGAAASAIAIDFSAMTQFANQSSINNVNADGQGAGDITGYEMLEDGSILARLSTSDAIKVGTIQLGTVQNIDGLVRDGNGLYMLSGTSGELIVGSPNSNYFGSLEGSSLENSTTDLATEFVNLVILQRGYQANSSMLSEVGTLLRETISLLR